MSRKAATEFLLTHIDMLLPGSKNREIYERKLSAMTDAEFAEFVNAIKTGKSKLVLFQPNASEHKLDMDTLTGVAKKLNYPLFRRLILTDPKTGLTYRTNKEYLVVNVPFRKQAQTQEAKVSIPENDKVVDQLTNQPTGPSKASKLSYPELQLLFAQGHESVITELIKFRGGDLKAYRAIKKQASSEGVASQELNWRLGSRVKSTELVKRLLLGMHIDSNL